MPTSCQYVIITHWFPRLGELGTRRGVCSLCENRARRGGCSLEIGSTAPTAKLLISSSLGGDLRGVDPVTGRPPPCLTAPRRRTRVEVRPQKLAHENGLAGGEAGRLKQPQSRPASIGRF